MKLSYYPETDALYINLSEQPSVESQEISEGILLDYDAEGRLVGIDIDNASHKCRNVSANLTTSLGYSRRRMRLLLGVVWN